MTLATQLAERLRRREALIAAASVTPSQSAAAIIPRPCPLPVERQLLPSDLRQLEVTRRSTQPSSAPAPVAVVPAAGEHRRRWLRSRLERLLREDTVVCMESEAVPAIDLLALFETVTGEMYADTPGTMLPSRVCGFGKVLGNVTREVTFDPALVQYSRRGRVYWNRRPRLPLDVETWRAGVQESERFALPVARLRDQRVASNAGLVEWVRQHRHLAPAEHADGESGMALLLLWEVDHGREFPRQGGDGSSAALLGFTRRLKQRVGADPELSQWLQPRDCHRALAPGLPPVHHVWWSVRISRPAVGEPQGWYAEFVRRWRLYLEALVQSAAAPPPAPATVELQPPAHTASSSSSSSSAAHPVPQPQSSRQQQRPSLPATSATATVPEGRPPKRSARTQFPRRPPSSVSELGGTRRTSPSLARSASET